MDAERRSLHRRLRVEVRLCACLVAVVVGTQAFYFVFILFSPLGRFGYIGSVHSIRSVRFGFFFMFRLRLCVFFHLFLLTDRSLWDFFFLFLF